MYFSAKHWQERQLPAKVHAGELELVESPVKDS